MSELTPRPLPGSHFSIAVIFRAVDAWSPTIIIDEGDSIAASRTQDHSHHEDKVAVNTLIQAIDDLRRFKGRISVILCTNRLAALDPALQRRAAIVEEFPRLDMKKQFTRAVCRIVETRPDTTYDNFARDFGERFVPGYKARVNR